MKPTPSVADADHDYEGRKSRRPAACGIPSRFMQGGLLFVVALACFLPRSAWSLLSEADQADREPGALLVGQSDDQDTTYGVIVDCGSSGTRANLYHWSNALLYPALLNDIEPMRDRSSKNALSLKKTPGLSSMKDEPEKASDYMKEILQFITDNIPQAAQRNTGVYIMATAGMRLLDEQIQQQIMNDIAKDILTRYNFAKVRTNVISGAQEGMYQWISVNSKAKRFAPAMRTGKELDGKRTYALIEVGGASIQVAYQLQPDLGGKILSKLPKNTGAQPAFVSQIVEPNISKETQGHKYELHSTTFLGLGSNSARDNYLDMLIKPGKRLDERIGRFVKNKLSWSRPTSDTLQKQPVVIKDPCMPVGASEERKKPKRMLSTKETKTLGFLEEEGEEMFSVKVVGTGNYAKCREKVSKFLKLCKKEGLHCKPEEPCTMHLLGTPFVPFDSYEFLGLGELYWATSYMDLHGQYKHHEIVHKTRETCELPIGQLEKKYPKASKDLSKSECFKAVFADTFLTEGLMMPLGYKGLTTVKEINQESVDWTLGAVLDMSLAIELAADEKDDDGDDDDFDDYEDFDDAEEAEEDAIEEQTEVQRVVDSQQSYGNSNFDDDHHHDLDLVDSNNGAADESDDEDEKERPHYHGELTDRQAALNMVQDMADSYYDDELMFSPVTAVRHEASPPSSSSSSFPHIAADVADTLESDFDMDDELILPQNGKSGPAPFG